MEELNILHPVMMQLSKYIPIQSMFIEYNQKTIQQNHGLTLESKYGKNCTDRNKKLFEDRINVITTDFSFPITSQIENDTKRKTIDKSNYWI